MPVRYTRSGVPYTAKPLGSKYPSRSSQVYSASMAQRSAGHAAVRYTKSGVPYTARPLYTKGREAGYVDLGLSLLECDTTGTISLVATMAQGASINQRIGKKAMYKSFQIRGKVQSNLTTTVADAAVLLVYDKRPQGTLPAVTDILTSANSKAFNNTQNEGRFKIIRRWDWTLIGNISTLATGKEGYNFDEYVKFRKPVVFKALGTGAIGDIEEGAVYLVTVGDAGGTLGALASMDVRTRFTEN